jgi:hypothetical protein
MGILQNIGFFENIPLNSEGDISWYQVLDQYTLLKGESKEFKKEEYICLSRKKIKIFRMKY